VVVAEAAEHGCLRNVVKVGAAERISEALLEVTRKLFLTGVASKMPFKSRLFKSQNHYSCALHFLHIPLIYLGLSWNRENWHGLEIYYRKTPILPATQPASLEASAL
jgi:hypothetical protein